MSKWTPGPWIIREFDLEQEPLAVVSEGGEAWVSQTFDIVSRTSPRRIAQAGFYSGSCEWNFITNYKEALANARLIAAAPEMAELLARGADLCERGHGQEWAIEARALLARLEGK